MRFSSYIAVVLGALVTVSAGCRDAVQPETPVSPPDPPEVQPPVGSKDTGPQIYVANADGTNPKRLAKGVDPVWSPDGSKISFWWNDEEDSEIFVMNADGTNLTQLTHNTMMDHGPRWSPDGSKIAFEGEGIFVINADGTGQKGITYSGYSGGIDFDPEWSPDGRQIAFTRTNDDFDVYDVVIYDAGGTSSVRVSNAMHPAWSPDGSQLAFSKYDAPTRTQSVSVISPDGSNPKPLIENASTPLWAPDGRRIAFSYSNEGTFVMNVDGTNRTRLTDEGPYAARWSPDASRIAFNTRLCCAIKIVPVNGSGESVLIENAFAPAWSPDGSRITFVRKHGEQSATPAAENAFLARFDDQVNVEPVVTDLSRSHIWDGYAVAAIDKVVLRYRKRGMEVEVVGLTR